MQMRFEPLQHHRHTHSQSHTPMHARIHINAPYMQMWFELLQHCRRTFETFHTPMHDLHSHRSTTDTDTQTHTVSHTRHIHVHKGIITVSHTRHTHTRMHKGTHQTHTNILSTQVRFESLQRHRHTQSHTQSHTPMHARTRTNSPCTQVRFESLEHAKKAASTLHGMKFEGRPVACSFVNVEIFEAMAARLQGQKWALKPAILRLLTSEKNLIKTHVYIYIYIYTYISMRVVSFRLSSMFDQFCTGLSTGVVH
jgi:hypothetical protein